MVRTILRPVAEPCGLWCPQRAAGAVGAAPRQPLSANGWSGSPRHLWESVHVAAFLRRLRIVTHEYPTGGGA